jgi:predicted DNA-binding transcriptional regulator AlpA
MSKTTNRPRRLHLDKHAADLATIEGNLDDDDDLLTSNQLAHWLGVSHQFVEISRIKNYGPKYTRLSARVIRYRRGDVRAWLRERSHRCTAEYA